MSTVSTVTRVYCPLPSTVTVTPSQYARVIIDDRDAGGAVNQVINSAQTFSVSAGGAFQIEAIGGDVTYTSTVSIESPDGGVYALSEAVSVVTLTATGTAFTGACEFRGFVVRAETGGTADATIYDATSATGTAIMTVSNISTGTYYWDGDHATPGVGNGGRRVNSTGCHVVISGTCTIDVMVE